MTGHCVVSSILTRGTNYKVKSQKSKVKSIMLATSDVNIHNSILNFEF